MKVFRKLSRLSGSTVGKAMRVRFTKALALLSALLPSAVGARAQAPFKVFTDYPTSIVGSD